MEIRLFDAERYRSDPHPTWAWLRQNDPLHWNEERQVWIASRYADVVHVSKHPKLFCSGQGVLPRDDQPISIVTMDEPRHGKLRRLVNRGFTPRMVQRLVPRIEKIVKDSIDAVADKGHCDFVTDLAVPLPLLILAELLGVRPEEHRRFQHWSDAMIAAGGDRHNEQVVAGAIQAFGELAEHLREVFENRRSVPRDDLVSILVRAQTEGTLDGEGSAGSAGAEGIEAMGDNELLMFMTALITAGNETTRNAISAGMHALIQHPEERAKLIAHPELLNRAVEEILRWTSPVMLFRRTVTQDTELRGRTLAEGDQVVMLYPSANRDEDVFPEADRFRVDRDPNPHVAFGIGNHFCLGANLARLEIRSLMGELIRRLPDIELEPGTEPTYTASYFVRGVEKMPVVFTPERARS